jgi:hypothetical protein
LMQTLVRDPGALLPLATLAGEDLPTFRKAFGTRVIAQLAILRRMPGYFGRSISDEIGQLISELSSGGN